MDGPRAYVLDLVMRSARRAYLELSVGQVGIFETPTVGRLLLTRSLLKTPGGGCVGGQLKIFGKAGRMS
jgi:hypothetical protein